MTTLWTDPLPFEQVIATQLLRDAGLRVDWYRQTNHGSEPPFAIARAPGRSTLTPAMRRAADAAGAARVRLPRGEFAVLSAPGYFLHLPARDWPLELAADEQSFYESEGAASPEIGRWIRSLKQRAGGVDLEVWLEARPKEMRRYALWGWLIGQDQ